MAKIGIVFSIKAFKFPTYMLMEAYAVENNVGAKALQP